MRNFFEKFLKFRSIPKRYVTKPRQIGSVDDSAGIIVYNDDIEAVFLNWFLDAVDEYRWRTFGVMEM